MLFENVVGRVGSPTLDAVPTAVNWSGRILGQSRSTGELPWRTVLAATGNNLQFAAGTARRVLPIRLESPLERPEDRGGFDHPDLLGHVAARRAALVADGLTMVRAYLVAGRPGAEDLPPWGSYEGFTDLVRGAIVFAGLPDPCLTRETLASVDHAADLGRQLVAGLREADPSGRGRTAAQLVELASGQRERFPTLADAIDEACPRGATATALGHALKAYKGRNFGGWRIDRAATAAHGGSARWLAQPVDRARPAATPGAPVIPPGRGGDGGDGEDESCHPEIAATSGTAGRVKVTL